MAKRESPALFCFFEIIWFAHLGAEALGKEGYALGVGGVIGEIDIFSGIFFVIIEHVTRLIAFFITIDGIAVALGADGVTIAESADGGIFDGGSGVF